MRKGSVLLAFIVFMLGTTAHGAGNWDFTSPAPEVGNSTTVEGVLRFEERHTVVPLNICGSRIPCVQSQPYWVMILSHAGVDYELDAQFQIGTSAAPDSLDVDDLVVRPGMILRADGTVEYLKSNYSIIGDAHHIAIVMDYANPSAN